MKKLDVFENKNKKILYNGYKWTLRGVEIFIFLCYNNAIFLRYSRKGDATWDFQKKLKESDRDAF